MTPIPERNMPDMSSSQDDRASASPEQSERFEAQLGRRRARALTQSDTSTPPFGALLAGYATRSAASSDEAAPVSGSSAARSPVFASWTVPLSLLNTEELSWMVCNGPLAGLVVEASLKSGTLTLRLRTQNNKQANQLDKNAARLRDAASAASSNPVQFTVERQPSS